MKRLTKEEYIKKMKEDGFVYQRFLGYWQLPNSLTSVSDLNAGKSYAKKYVYMKTQVAKLGVG